MADDTGTDPEPTGAERYLADRLRDPKYRAAYAAFRSQFPLPDTADDTGTDAELHYLNGFRDGMLESARLLLAAPTSTHGSRQSDAPGGVPRVHDRATSADGDPQHVWNTYALRDFVTAHMLDQLEALGFPHPDERTDR